MNERNEALILANRILDRPNADPDDDLAMLSRQLIRANEETEILRHWLHTLSDAIRAQATTDTGYILMPNGARYYCSKKGNAT